MDGFVHQGQITRVVFGSGTRLRIAEEVSALGCRRAVVLSTPGQAVHAADVRELLVDMAAGVFTEAAMHTPSHITGAAVRFVGAQRADCLVSVGGGSAIGLGKAVSLRTGLPHIALPTTYAGSEMSPILGETDGERKTTRRLPEVRLRTVVYDVDLTVTLPPGTAAASGLNALAHAVEALYARDRDPLAFLMAGEAITALTAHLPVIVERPDASRPAAGRCTEPGWPVLVSARSAWLCTTRSVTSSGARSHCRTPQPTRSYCRMSWRSTRRPRRGR